MVDSNKIGAVDGITADNAKRENKEALEEAKKTLESALRDFDGNRTAEESKALWKKLETVKAALAAIAEEEKNIPATGDTSHPGLWIALLFVSGGIAGGTAAVRKKKNMP